MFSDVTFSGFSKIIRLRTMLLDSVRKRERERERERKKEEKKREEISIVRSMSWET